jgi:hypothetical protein
MPKATVASRAEEWDARHLALTKEERSALVARRARALLHMLRGWRRVEDVLMTSIERRRRACMYVIRDAREQMERHGSARFPGHELTYRLIVLLKWSTRLRLHSPRYDARAADFNFNASAWRTIESIPGERRDGAFMKFVGLPAFLFDDLAVKFERASTTLGRPTKLTERDCLALALRFMTTSGRLKDLEVDFGCVDQILQRELWPALERLRSVLFATPDAQCRVPSKEEGYAMERAARMRYGSPPLDFARPACLYMDGTILAVHGVSIKEDQAKLAYYGGKQMAVNNCLVFDQYGCVVAYVICAPGCFHDARIARTIFEKLSSDEWNPNRFGCIVDSGYTGHDKTGDDGEAAIFRPMKGEHVDMGALNELALKFSAYIVTRRQANEWANGALKRSWPRILVPAEYARLDKLQLVLEVAIHLQNFRTRRVGFNELKTTFMPYVDAMFKEQLLAAREARGAAGLALYFKLLKEEADKVAALV